MNKNVPEIQDEPADEDLGLFCADQEFAFMRTIPRTRKVASLGLPRASDESEEGE